MSKYFTVEEANRTLPLVRRITSDIVEAHRVMLDRIVEYRGLDADSGIGRARQRELEREIRSLADMVSGHVAELEEVGALFKGFEDGLVDFYGVLDGRPVFLCWKLGEESIEWWHELKAGFAGRQRLPAHLLTVGGSE